MANALLQVHSRTGDPETSRQAARSVKIQKNRLAVLQVMHKITGSWTDGDLVSVYWSEAEAGRVAPQSPSGIRSRRWQTVVDRIPAGQ
jgi:hypothetical protein